MDGAWLTDLDLNGQALEWKAEGFADISNTLPQRFSAVFADPNGNIRLYPTLSENTEFLCEEETCFLEISPIARFSRSKASYTLSFSSSQE